MGKDFGRWSKRAKSSKGREKKEKVSARHAAFAAIGIIGGYLLLAALIYWGFAYHGDKPLIGFSVLVLFVSLIILGLTRLGKKKD